MKCKKLKILCGIFFLAFCSLFGFSSSVYATSEDDYVLEYTKSSSFIYNGTTLVSSSVLSQYKYVITTINNPHVFNSTSIVNFTIFNFTLNCSSNNYLNLVTPITIFSIPNNDSCRNPGLRTSAGWEFDKVLNDDDIFTITLTNNEPFSDSDCPICEECKECPAIPDNPYDDKLDNIVNAIYICAATLLVIYFFYCIYRMIIKNSGVK